MKPYPLLHSEERSVSQELAAPSFAGISVPQASSPQTHILLEYWQIVMTRCWIIASFLACVVLLATIASVRMMRLYQAVGRIAISKAGSDILGLKQAPGTESNTDAWDYTIELDTQRKMLQSDALALQVISDLRLYRNDPRFRTVAGVAKTSL